MADQRKYRRPISAVCFRGGIGTVVIAGLRDDGNYANIYRCSPIFRWWGYGAKPSSGPSMLKTDIIALCSPCNLSQELLSTVFFLSYPLGLSVWFDNPLYRSLLRVSALTFLIRPLANINNAKLHRAMRFKETARHTIFLWIERRHNQYHYGSHGVGGLEPYLFRNNQRYAQCISTFLSRSAKACHQI